MRRSFGIWMVIFFATLAFVVSPAIAETFPVVLDDGTVINADEFHRLSRENNQLMQVLARIDLKGFILDQFDMEKDHSRNRAYWKYPEVAKKMATRYRRLNQFLHAALAGAPYDQIQKGLKAYREGEEIPHIFVTMSPSASPQLSHTSTTAPVAVDRMNYPLLMIISVVGVVLGFGFNEFRLRRSTKELAIYRDLYEKKCHEYTDIQCRYRQFETDAEQLIRSHSQKNHELEQRLLESQQHITAKSGKIQQLETKLLAIDLDLNQNRHEHDTFEADIAKIKEQFSFVYRWPNFATAVRSLEGRADEATLFEQLTALVQVVGAGITMPRQGILIKEFGKRMLAVPNDIVKGTSISLARYIGEGNTRGFGSKLKS